MGLCSGLQQRRGGVLRYCVLYYSHLAIDHASLSRGSTVPTPNRDTSNIWALITFFPCTKYYVFFFLWGGAGSDFPLVCLDLIEERGGGWRGTMHHHPLHNFLPSARLLSSPANLSDLLHRDISSCCQLSHASSHTITILGNAIREAHA